MTAEPPTPRQASARVSSGVVVPVPLAWHQRLLARMIYLGVRAVTATLRFRWDIHPHALPTDQALVIFATWHNRVFLSCAIYDGLARRANRSPRLAVMVSASRDGGLLARVLEQFGVQPVRGSSSRRGPQALRELVTWAERGYDLALTPDGPRGPRYVVQAGVIALAQLTGRPIVPVSFHASWKVCAPSWDRFQVPLPGSRCVIRVGAPLLVSSESTESQRESLRKELEARLNQLTVD